MNTLGLIEESVDIAIEAANRHCQELDHDDHGHGHHDNDHKAVKAVDDLVLTAVYEKILTSIRGQTLYLYESGHISMNTLGLIEESVDIAIEAANRHCQELDHLKNSGDPVLKNIHKDKGRRTEMSIAVFWEHLEHYLYDCWDERGVYGLGFCPGCTGKQGS